MSDGTGDRTGPALRIVRGAPTAEELAALTALMAAAPAAAPAGGPAQPVRGRWNDPARAHRQLPLPGPGAWRAAR